MNEETSTNTLEEVNSPSLDGSSDKKAKALFITNVVVNSIFYFFIFLLLLFSISQIAGSKEGKVKNVLGLGYETVLTDSMYVKERPGLTIYDASRAKNKKTSFDAGDLVWVNTLNSKQKKKLKIGDIVTFWDTKDTNPTSNKNGFLNTHRIVDFIYDPLDGSISSYVLQGDMYLGSTMDWSIIKEKHASGEVSDSEFAKYLYNGQFQKDYSIQVVGAEDIKAKYATKWDNMGHFVLWLSNPKKGFIVVILFAVAFLLFEMFMVIKNMMGLKTEKMALKAADDKEAIKEEMRKSLADERERMRAELLAELKKEQEANDQNLDNNIDSNENESNYEAENNILDKDNENE